MRTRTWLRCRRRKVEEEKKSEKWLWWGQFLWRWWWITAFSQKSTHESCNPKVTNIALGKTGIAFLADDWTVAFKLRGSGRILQGSQSVVLKGPTWSQQSLVKSWADVFVFFVLCFFSCQIHSCDHSCCSLQAAEAHKHSVKLGRDPTQNCWRKQSHKEVVAVGF